MSSPVGARAPAGDPLLPAWSPVARLPTRQRSRCAPCDCRFPSLRFLRLDRRLGLPGCPARPPQPPRRSPEGSPRGVKIILLPSPLHLVKPVGPPLLVTAIAGCPDPAAPFLGSRLACAVRYEGHSARRISAGQGVFFKYTGLSAGNAGYTQNFSVRPPPVHKLYTGRRVDERGSTRLNDAMISVASPCTPVGATVAIIIIC